MGIPYFVCIRLYSSANTSVQSRNSETNATLDIRQDSIQQLTIIRSLFKSCLELQLWICPKEDHQQAKEWFVKPLFLLAQWSVTMKFLLDLHLKCLFGAVSTTWLMRGRLLTAGHAWEAGLISKGSQGTILPLLGGTEKTQPRSK
jgi:hypothetical protein